MRHADARFFAHAAGYGHKRGDIYKYVHAHPWSKRDAHCHGDGYIGSTEYGDVDINSYRHAGEYIHTYLDTDSLGHAC